MTIFVLGADGYIGWNLMMYLGVRRDEDIIGVDSMLRRKMVEEVKSDSGTPILPMNERIEAYKEVFNKNNLSFIEGDLQDLDFTYKLFEEHKPTAVINLAQIPSAPYSMIDAKHSADTKINNVLANNSVLWAMMEHTPDAHLIKLGTMGEYGIPNIDIPEGYFDIEYRGRKDTLPFPKQPGSFYHITKAYDTLDIALACKIWKLAATDIMQGVVFGVTTDESAKDERLLSRFDYDGVFGTVINRYVAQAVTGMPLTPYGTGGQRRGMLSIKDSLRCIELYLDNPAKPGEHRVFNQYTEDRFNVTELAEKVVKLAKEKGLDPKIEHIVNPRFEAEEHYYNPDHEGIMKLGLEPHDIDNEISILLEDIMKYKDRIITDSIKPTIGWNKEKQAELNK